MQTQEKTINQEVSPMNVYWYVETRFYVDGKVKVSINSKEYDHKPRNTYERKTKYDVYVDWFDVSGKVENI